MGQTPHNMPRTKESARRVSPKPYDHTQPRACCIMRCANLKEKFDSIIKSCDDMTSEISDMDDMDEYERIRMGHVTKTIICIKKLAEHQHEILVRDDDECVDVGT